MNSFLSSFLLPILLVLFGLLSPFGNGEKTEFLSHRQHPDRIDSLPGFSMPLPSPWYSGFLTYELEGRTIHTHYVLVEAEEDDNGNVESKPFVYWTNGGPGASSMFGLMTELGPLIMSDLSLLTDDYRKTGIPTPIYNKYSWTKLATVLIFDAPAPVGFSYCDPLPGEKDIPVGESCGSWTDELASLNSYMALEAFFKQFPYFHQKELYLTGESYAGIYVPTMARRILEGDDEITKKNLVGFAVGDGCLGTETNVCEDMPRDFFFEAMFFAGHHQVPLKTFRLMLEECGGLHGTKVYSPNCTKAIDLCMDQLGGFYAYGLYDDCTYENGMYLLREQAKNRRKKQALADSSTATSEVGVDGQDPDRAATFTRLLGAVNDYPCGGVNVMTTYLDNSDVKAAFHMTGKDFFDSDNAVGFDYTPTEPTLEEFYKSVNGKLRVLVYNGDADPSINSFEAANWTRHLGFPLEKDWTPWTTDGCQRMGGYVTRYGGNFDFLTIRGSGHMVPTYKPEASFVFLKSWLENSEYPGFDPGCSGSGYQHAKVAKGQKEKPKRTIEDGPVERNLRSKNN